MEFAVPLLARAHALHAALGLASARAGTPQEPDLISCLAKKKRGLDPLFSLCICTELDTK